MNLESLKRASGFFYGVVSSATFGLIPLFTVPLLTTEGMPFMSVLTYRFIFATFFLALLLLFRKQNFKVRLQDLWRLALLAGFYIVSSLFLIWGYTFMFSGVATTIHFMYPVITTLLMMFLFHEKKSAWRIGAVLTAIAGVYFLSMGGSSGDFDWAGVVIVLISALGYAVYLVAIGQMKRLEVKGLKLTFYVFLLSTLMLLAGMLTFGDLVPVSGASQKTNLLLLAFIPTVISNLTLVESIKRIGSTLTSVLGAMEPLTAVLVGILVFGEEFTQNIALGVLLIVSAVCVIILKR
ncbi:membrane protein containing DUF6, transmembrane [gut metagenome]|uniref:Membrane protein containing DUF6, transmembrane n=1 Tax=gut metagenome TaxID=749906 RepID=J9GM01_9ZZZZ